MNHMEEALIQANKAYYKKEVPVGAVIVKNNKIIAKSHNKREKNNDVMAHAEVLAIKKASKRLKTWKLNECELYVTLKPCEMCEIIINHSRIKKVIYLVDRLECKKQYNKTIYELYINNNLTNSKYIKKMQDFFKKLR